MSKTRSILVTVLGVLLAACLSVAVGFALRTENVSADENGGGI